MSTRFQDWPIRLEKEIKKRMDSKFSYGRHDCCLAAARCIQAINGDDLFFEIIKEYGEYKGRKAAEDALYKEGGVQAIAEKFAKKFGYKEIKVLRAIAGDVVLYNNNEGGYSLGVVELSGRNFLVPSKEKGWVQVPINLATKAWRI